MNKISISTLALGIILTCINLAFLTVDTQNVSESEFSKVNNQGIGQESKSDSKEKLTNAGSESKHIEQSVRESSTSSKNVLNENNMLRDQLRRLQKDLNKVRSHPILQLEKLIYDQNSEQLILKDDDGNNLLSLDLTKRIVDLSDNIIFGHNDDEGNDDFRLFLYKSEILEGNIPEPVKEEFRDSTIEYTFKNNSDQDLDLFWIDSEGRVNHDPIKAGDSIIQEESIGRTWVLYDKEGNRIRDFVQSTPEKDNSEESPNRCSVKVQAQ